MASRRFYARVASVAESYFNISGATSKFLTRLECESDKLRERVAKLESDNTKISQGLQEQEERVWILEPELEEKRALEASLRSCINVSECREPR